MDAPWAITPQNQSYCMLLLLIAGAPREEPALGFWIVLSATLGLDYDGN